MLWTIDCERSKPINLLIKNSTIFLECFLKDYKDRSKRFNEWTKVTERLQSEIAQVLACNVREIQACGSNMKGISAFFSNS